MTPDLPRGLCGTFGNTANCSSLEYKMWKYLSGCEQPPPKKAKSKDDVLENNRLYEKSQRQRSFHTSWKQGRLWLVLEDNLMICKVCKEATAADATVVFVSGNAQLQV